jgi:hypothetical protein
VAEREAALIEQFYDLLTLDLSKAEHAIVEFDGNLPWRRAPEPRA